MDTVRQWIDPAYQGIKLIQGATKANPNPANAIDSLPVPVPQPPITAANPEVLAAQSDFEKANLLKKSVKNTILAGDTGGFFKGEGGYPGSPASATQGFKGKF